MLGDGSGAYNPMAMNVQGNNYNSVQGGSWPKKPNIGLGLGGELGSGVHFPSGFGSVPGNNANQYNLNGVNPSSVQNEKSVDYPPGTVLYTWKNKPVTNKKNTTCTNCGKKNHSRESCFKIVGYPEWYPEFKKKKQAEAASTGEKGKATLVVTGKAEKGSEGEGNVYLSHSNFGTKKNNSWIIDSGATDHMTFCKNDMNEYSEPEKIEILNANGISYPVTGMGDVHISPSLTLRNTLLVPSLSTRLISVGQLVEELNCVVIMYPNCCIFQDILTKEVIGRGIKKGRLYHLEDLRIGETNLARGYSKAENEIWTWHRRLGHPSFSYLNKLLPSLFLGLDVSNFTCETCVKAKSHRVSYKQSFNKCSEPFDLIHSDVWGPAPIDSIAGYKWFVLFIDDCTRMTWIYLLKRKEEVMGSFKKISVWFKPSLEKGLNTFVVIMEGSLSIET
jgi:GAG-pre-integrase domain